MKSDKEFPAKYLLTKLGTQIEIPYVFSSKFHQSVSLYQHPFYKPLSIIVHSAKNNEKK